MIVGCCSRPFLWSMCLPWLLPLTVGRTEEPLRFNRDIRPILSDACFACHGFDEKKREGELRLDTAEGALSPSTGTPAIVPGKPEESLLWQRIIASDPDERMPPPNVPKILTDKQKETLRRWIAEGANYERHWAFEPPVAPSIPRSNTHPIDAFLEERLERFGLQVRGEADRPTLIRRLSFALTGLPPTIEEVDRFLSDSSPDAYEKLVDRSLNKIQYGEEMARHWLDVARYADTHGLHLDNEREMWAYRDWVIRAFNENIPFDQFTIWQLAGDLLPNPTREQRIATGFCRCNVTTSEGGALDDEYRFLYAVDRTSTMIETWMGLTGGCAVCHDHKFDPLSSREYYSLYAFFNNAADPPMDKNISRTTPFLKLPSTNQEASIAQANVEITKKLKALERYAANGNALASNANAASPPDDRSREKLVPASATPRPTTASPQLVFDDLFPYGSNSKNTTRNPSVWDSQPPAGVPSGKRALKQASSYFTQDEFDSGALVFAVPSQGELALWVCPDAVDPPQIIAVSLKQGSPHVAYWGDGDLVEHGFPDTESAKHQGPIPRGGEWTELRIPLEAVGLKQGQAITDFSLQQSGGIVWWDRCEIRGSLSETDHPGLSFDAWWKAARQQKFSGINDSLSKTLKMDPSKVTDDAARNALRTFFVARVMIPNDRRLSRLRQSWEEALVAREIIESQVNGSMIYNDEAQVRTSYVMERGQYNKPTLEVQPDVPGILPPLLRDDPQRRPTRLDLARWLVSPDHPLTARVTVNRFWQQFFGTGLVKTSHDFGSQGEPPTHPELLDWLAMDFQKSGWDVKRLVRLMVTSAAFRRDATVDDQQLQMDPDNRWYARGARFRLDAEQIRDMSLFVSGLMSERRGGRGSLPYQPPNIWEPVGYQNSNTRYYLQGHGDDLYRRSIYCFLKRTAPPPFMSNFDGPNREQFCTRRERSNTPLQALQLLNDVQHFEAARALAERTIEQESVDASRLNRMFRSVLSRAPDPSELALLTEALEKQRSYYRQHPDQATKVMDTGESEAKRLVADEEGAAWTMVANLVLNLDESISRN